MLSILFDIIIMITLEQLLYFGARCILSVFCFTILTKGIECVHVTSSNSQIQNQRATKGFIIIRHKRYQLYSILRLETSTF